jgi:hypothetical protein
MYLPASGILLAGGFSGKAFGFEVGRGAGIGYPDSREGLVAPCGAPGVGVAVVRRAVMRGLGR